MLRNKDRKLTRRLRNQSGNLEDIADQTRVSAIDVGDWGADFQLWASKLTDEGIIDGAESLENDLVKITLQVFEVQKNAADTISKICEIRDTLRKLKTRRNNREKQDGKKTWEQLQVEEAGNAQARRLAAR